LLAIQETYAKKKKDDESEPLKFSFKEYVNLKCQYETLVDEMNLLTDVKKEKERLLKANDRLDMENNSLRKELSLKDERIRSLENTSFELPPIKTDSEKEYLKKENARCKINLDVQMKRVQQLENDLRETDDSFDKANEKAANLEKQLEKVIIIIIIYVPRSISENVEMFLQEMQVVILCHSCSKRSRFSVSFCGSHLMNLFDFLK